MSVPLASNMLNNNNENNILEEKGTIKIINNINNIIINNDKNKTINNGMIININNNYFQLKNPKKLNEKLIKRVKSKEERPKESFKDKKNLKIRTDDKEEDFTQYTQYKIVREKRAFTNYNTQHTLKSEKKYQLNEVQSPNIKKENANNNNKRHIPSMNSNDIYINTNYTVNSKHNNIYRNNNNLSMNNKKNIKNTIGNKTSYNNTHMNTNNKNTITEINTNTNYKNVNGNKLKITMKKNKEKVKLDGAEPIENKKMSVNRKIVNNYLTTTQKKKTYQEMFPAQDSLSLNTYVKKKTDVKKSNNTTEKIEILNIYNTIQSKNKNSNPIKFKLDKKHVIKKIKTNSLQINNKNEFLSSFNLNKDKIPSTIEIDIINVEDNYSNCHKQTINNFLANKTQSNSEAELIRELNYKKNYANTNNYNSKSLKKEICKNKTINVNENMNNNNVINNNNTISTGVRKMNAKEMKEKYHKLLRGNKFTHGSYDTENRLHLLKKFRGLNSLGTMANTIINTTITSSNKRSPLIKKNILSPSERIPNNISNYIKTPIKRKVITNKDPVIEKKSAFEGKKVIMIDKRSKQTDTNNKRMRYIQK